VQVPERDPQGWVLKALREAGNSLVSEFYGVDEDALRRRPSDDEFCLKEIACHLRDAEELASRQITSLIEHPHRPLPAWDVDVLPLERDYRAADMREALAEFRELRRETTYALWGLTESDWRRSVKHPYRGEVTIETIARELAQHDLEHLWQVRRLKDGLDLRVNVNDDWDRDDW
jgi:hypothetical protein